MSESINSSEVKVRMQGRGGYIEIDAYKFEIDAYKFEIEMMYGDIDYCVYFSNKQLDKNLIRARKKLESFTQPDSLNWEIQEYDSPHGFYDAMTVNERLFAASLFDEYEFAESHCDKTMMIAILEEVELSDSNINAILKSENKGI